MEKFLDSMDKILLKQWLREGRERNSCSYCAVVVCIRREGVLLLVFQKWVSCIMIELNDRVKVAELYSDVLISLSRARLRAFSTSHLIAR